MHKDEGGRMKDEGRSFCPSLLLVLVLFSSFILHPSSFAQVQITFLPPPMEGVLSMGIYDKKGKLVRVLHREATEKNFTVGLNGFITSWDGKDDAGKTLPAGAYFARGFAVGAVTVEGVAIHGNDWIEDEEAPRPLGVSELRARGDEAVDVVLKTQTGVEVKTIEFGTPKTNPLPPPAFTVKVTGGKVTVVRGEETRDFPLGEGESALDAAIGAADALWLVVQAPTGSEVRQYASDGEFLRRLGYTPGEPQPRRIVASRSADHIVLLEENAKLQQVRSLIRSDEPSPPNPDPATPPVEPASIWKTVLEKSLWRGESFDAVKDLLQRPGGKPFTPEKEFVVKLVDNELLKNEPSTARVNIGFNEKGSYLQTTDGLPLRRITETPNLKWAVIGREGSGRLLTILQSDGAAVEEFRASKLANMMMFDAGDYEWAGK
jgi:hypothetical protein